MSENIVDINVILDRIIKETGIDQKELSVLLGYNEAYLSQARQRGTKKLYKALENYEREFRKSKNLNHAQTTPLTSKESQQDDFQAKYIASQEETIKLFRELLENKQALDRRLDKIEKDIEIFRKSHNEIQGNFTEAAKVIDEVRRAQVIMYSLQNAYYEHWLSSLPDKEDVWQTIVERAALFLGLIREKGIQIDLGMFHNGS